MFIHVVKADYVSGFKIKLEFDNSKSGIVDLSDDLEGEIFEPLKDINYFKKFDLNTNAGTITWKNGADFAPEYLYKKATKK
jgi:hypothetical protein